MCSHAWTTRKASECAGGRERFKLVVAILESARAGVKLVDPINEGASLLATASKNVRFVIESAREIS